MEASTVAVPWSAVSVVSRSLYPSFFLVNSCLWWSWSCGVLWTCLSDLAAAVHGTASCVVEANVVDDPLSAPMEDFCVFPSAEPVEALLKGWVEVGRRRLTHGERRAQSSRRPGWNEAEDSVSTKVTMCTARQVLSLLSVRGDATALAQNVLRFSSSHQRTRRFTSPHPPCRHRPYLVIENLLRNALGQRVRGHQRGLCSMALGAR